MNLLLPPVQSILYDFEVASLILLIINLCKKSKTESDMINVLLLHVYAQTGFSVVTASGKECLS